jgi:hypothetical protein
LITEQRTTLKLIRCVRYVMTKCITCLCPQCSYHDFSIDTIYALLFGDMVSVNHLNSIKIVQHFSINSPFYVWDTFQGPLILDHWPRMDTNFNTDYEQIHATVQTLWRPTCMQIDSFVLNGAQNVQIRHLEVTVTAFSRMY